MRYPQYTAGSEKIPLVTKVLRGGEEVYDRAAAPNVPRVRERPTINRRLTAMRLPGIQHEGAEREDAIRSKPRVAGGIFLVVCWSTAKG